MTTVRPYFNSGFKRKLKYIRRSPIVYSTFVLKCRLFAGLVRSQYANRQTISGHF
ncbi:MAG: hypothetical protein KME27_30765 [Lyngbya sp. HA4199-MV5]|nr:hypothetical protein [Lyngbya sp. HA4199-MV5]